jgi:F-type H+-transporting ATPase subunit delta
MSSITTLARPYAKAAFELAHDGDTLARWSEMLDLAGSMAGDESMMAILTSPEISSDVSLGLITEAGGELFNARFLDFLSVLSANDRLTVLPEIRRIYEKFRQEAEQRLQVRVLSAAALDESQAERMREALANRFGREIELESEIDAEVLGGAVIYAGDQVIDGSLRGRLNKLEQSLAN